MSEFTPENYNRYQSEDEEAIREEKQYQEDKLRQGEIEAFKNFSAGSALRIHFDPRFRHRYGANLFQLRLLTYLDSGCTAPRLGERLLGLPRNRSRQ